MTTADASTGTETAPAETTSTTDTTDTGTETDLGAEVEKWKTESRKQEQRAKANAAAARELEQFKASQMTETEKAVAQAKAEGRAEALREAASSLVLAEVRAAAAGRPVDVDALLEGIDASRFLDTDANPDRQAIEAWVDRVAPIPEPSGRPTVDLGQGARGGQAMALNGDPLEKALRAKVGAPKR